MKHKIPQTAMRMAVRALLEELQLPLLVVMGLRYWKRKTVPAGRSFMRFPKAEKTVEAEELVEELLLEDDDVVVALVVVVAEDLENAEEIFFTTDEIALIKEIAAPAWAAITYRKRGEFSYVSWVCNKG
ncbi:hypothetical protein SAY86_028007 [Trapa natans]|uniref:Uncharacterized protein n=1 Tax=Trapa natans TaxID=22666 RepID=A0AAN7MGS8_TRANT|nr:hypothetical protein SAY86_028007 [Trapa natans]